MGLTNQLKTALIDHLKADTNVAALNPVYVDDSVSSIIEESEKFVISVYPKEADNTSGTIGRNGHYFREYLFYIGCGGKFNLDNDAAQTNFYDFMDTVYTSIMDSNLRDQTTLLDRPIFILKSHYLHDPDDSQPFLWVGLHICTLTTRVARNC